MFNLRRYMIIIVDEDTFIVDENTYTYVASFDTLTSAVAEVHKRIQDDIADKGHVYEYKIIDLKEK